MLECADSILPPTESDIEEEHARRNRQCTSERLSRCDLVERNIDFLHDDPEQMTFARRIALHLTRYSWYNPHLKGNENADRAGNYIEMNQIGSVGNMSKDEIGTVASFNKSMTRTPIQEEQPSLEKAWAYFDHTTLPRYLDHGAAAVSGPDSTDANSQRTHGHGFPRQMRKHFRRILIGDEEVMDLAEPGENRYPTKLYSPLWTPMNQMGDFGLGVGLYFTAIRSITILAFACFLLNLPNMIYFAGEEYSNGQDGVDISLKGSAVCTAQQFVPCPSCTIDDFADTPHRIASASDAYGNDLVFVVKNFCDGAKRPLATVNYATLILVTLGLAWINHYLKKQTVLYDEDEQTAQDYSIVIRNPPPDATNPEEWKQFFDNKFGPSVHVTCCTVAKDNFLLLRALVRRRELLQKLKWTLPPGSCLKITSLLDLSQCAQDARSLLAKMKALVLPGVPELVSQLVEANQLIEKLSELNFPATRVFITFETEAAQRKVLSLLSVGSKAIRRNDVMKVTSHDHLFRSNLVLNVKEADEPSTIRWQDLGDRFYERFLRMLMTTYAWACSMALVAFIVRLCSHRSAKFAAYAIAFFNIAFPEFAKLLVNYESHPSESRRQSSMFIKIVAFRWINTAIIVYMITPFASTLSSGNDNILDGVCEIFLAEIVTTNLIKLVDPGGIYKRHYKAPRAKSQEEMNSFMRGEEWNLAERYTNMSKIVFLTLWYSSIFPIGFLYCALALSINYFTDRYNLMRTWRQAPRLGSHISTFSRRYFFPLAITAMAIASSYTWAGFTFDNLCANEDGDDAGGDEDELAEYVGNWEVTSADGSRVEEVSVAEGETTYRFCQQSLYWYGKGFNFPAIPYWQQEGQEWMTVEQEQVTSVYGWTSFALVVAVCIFILQRSVSNFMYRSGYEACGEDQGIDFSEVATISSYIPQVQSDLFPCPLLAVDTDDVDEELYEWKDPDKPYSYYDVTRDAREVLSAVETLSKKDIKSLFSRIQHWPPPPKEKDGNVGKGLVGESETVVVPVHHHPGPQGKFC